jgi:hypothetical protein
MGLESLLCPALALLPVQPPVGVSQDVEREGTDAGYWLQFYGLENDVRPSKISEQVLCCLNASQ